MAYSSAKKIRLGCSPGDCPMLRPQPELALVVLRFRICLGVEPQSTHARYATTDHLSPLNGSTQCSSLAPLNICHFRFSVILRNPRGSWTISAPPVNGPNRAIAELPWFFLSLWAELAKFLFRVTCVVHGCIFFDGVEYWPRFQCLALDWLGQYLATIG